MLTKQFRELNRQAQVIENHKNMVNKQETLEEASESYAKEGCWENIRKQGFITGAEWQAERMYSEEEVLKLLKEFHFVDENYKTWFEQNKKK
jgi:hypothetical protein